MIEVLFYYQSILLVFFQNDIERLRRKMVFELLAEKLLWRLTVCNMSTAANGYTVNNICHVLLYCFDPVWQVYDGLADGSEMCMIAIWYTNRSQLWCSLYSTISYLWRILGIPTWHFINDVVFSTIAWIWWLCDNRVWYMKDGFVVIQYDKSRQIWDVLP